MASGTGPAPTPQVTFSTPATAGQQLMTTFSEPLASIIKPIHAGYLQLLFAVGPLDPSSAPVSSLLILISYIILFLKVLAKNGTAKKGKKLDRHLFYGYA